MEINSSDSTLRFSLLGHLGPEYHGLVCTCAGMSCGHPDCAPASPDSQCHFPKRDCITLVQTTKNCPCQFDVYKASWSLAWCPWTTSANYKCVMDCAAADTGHIRLPCSQDYVPGAIPRVLTHLCSFCRITSACMLASFTMFTNSYEVLTSGMPGYVQIHLYSSNLLKIASGCVVYRLLFVSMHLVVRRTCCSSRYI